MPVTNGYCTASELKAFLRITDAVDDTQIERAINAASRLIDGACRRRFYAATETRYYDAVDPVRLLVDDLLSVTTLQTDDDGDGICENTLTASADYLLEPSGADTSVPPQPFHEIRIAAYGNYVFPVGVNRGVKIVGSWGFSSTTPDAVNHACVLEAARLFKRNASILGIAGTPELGMMFPAKTVNGLDFDAWQLLSQGGYVRYA